MTERKPEGLSWQSWVDRQIRDGQTHGAFDDLGGAGRPIADIGVVHDELWWVRAKMRAEDLEYLPPTIAIRAERAAALDAAHEAPTEDRARSIIDGVNARIRDINRRGAPGPPSTAVVIDVEAVLRRRREAHTSSTAPDAEPIDAEPIDAEPCDIRPIDDQPTVVRRRWWHRLRGRSRP